MPELTGHGGKGSAPRAGRNDAAYRNNYDRAFAPSEERFTVKELAPQIKRSEGYIYAMKKAGFPMPGGTATIGEALAWLTQKPGFRKNGAAADLADEQELKRQVAAYRTMCMAAYNEILGQIEAHTCKKTGLTCSNLLSRLSGKLPPDIYPTWATDEELRLFTPDNAKHEAFLD